MSREVMVMCPRCGGTKLSGKQNPCLSCLTKRCERWNREYPVGTTVEYHPVIGEPAHRIRTTRTEAQVLSGHTAVVWLDGESGCVCLDACVPVQGAAA